MDLTLSQLESLLHYVAICLILAPEVAHCKEGGYPCGCMGLPHHFSGCITSKLDGQEINIAIMNGMTSNDCEDLMEDKHTSLP
ncbi:hypothetical protein PAXRUDRAFT_21613 [Paxillus rubicundulus Ve08.2h10]|uniref:Unplaced genomic scaffold scaffold_5648, whole genome shotgun sequence n=1 Tax=Paxillus rubicundulus Ve08.2h10 TaxID=930991 RepID=A0A0D0BM48_9AGAM|nr:hypothetical protein PAXRUDRAFT_21613 [Paxillus rubicundulus Ve08.2h10]